MSKVGIIFLKAKLLFMTINGCSGWSHIPGAMC